MLVKDKSLTKPKKGIRIEKVAKVNKSVKQPKPVKRVDDVRKRSIEPKKVLIYLNFKNCGYRK